MYSKTLQYPWTSSEELEHGEFDISTPPYSQAAIRPGKYSEASLFLGIKLRKSTSGEEEWKLLAANISSSI